MNRREFLKRIALVATIPIITNIDIDLLRNDYTKFTTKQLENIKKIKRIEYGEYMPYFHVSDPIEYKVVLNDRKVFYSNRDELEKDYGPILDYWKKDKNYSVYLPKNRDGWLL